MDGVTLMIWGVAIFLIVFAFLTRSKKRVRTPEEESEYGKERARIEAREDVERHNNVWGYDTTTERFEESQKSLRKSFAPIAKRGFGF